MDTILKSLLIIVVVLSFIYFVLLLRVQVVEDSQQLQCEQIGGALIRDHRNDFRCVALIKMENNQ